MDHCSRHGRHSARLVNLLQEIEILPRLPAIHPAGGNIGRNPAGHGASHRVKRVGRACQFQTQHVAPQEQLIPVYGSLACRVQGRTVTIGDTGSAAGGVRKVSGDGSQIVGLHQGVGVQADKERIVGGVVQVRECQVEPDLASQADPLFGGKFPSR